MPLEQSLSQGWIVIFSMVIGKKMVVTDNQPGQLCISFSVKANSESSPYPIQPFFLLLFTYAASLWQFRMLA